MSDSGQPLPEDLELMAPGPQLASLLASVDRTLLSETDRVRLVRARNRLVAHMQGELFSDMYAVSWAEPPEDGLARSGDDGQYPWTEMELSFALRWTRVAAGVRLEQARALVEDLPAVHRALSAGTIDVPKALLVVDMVRPLALDAARAVVDEVLARAPEWTTGQLRARLRRLVMAADPDATGRASQQIEGRRVQVFLNDNNLAALAGYELAPHRVAAGWERLDAIARAARSAGDRRTMDQLRADTLLDLLAGEGVATGGPVTDGDLGQDGKPATISGPGPSKREPEADPPWPQAPADPRLLDEDADPPHGPPPAPALDQPYDQPSDLPVPPPPPPDDLPTDGYSSMPTRTTCVGSGWPPSTSFAVPTPAVAAAADPVGPGRCPPHGRA